MDYYLYIMTNKKNGTLYIGSTSNLLKRVWEHRSKVIKSFTSKYNLDKLIYYEGHHVYDSVSLREKQLKKWRREWKVELIERCNPDWVDLFYSLSL